MPQSQVVYATATEDMDALTFGTPILLRHFTMSEARKMPIQQFNLKEVPRRRARQVLRPRSRVSLFFVPGP